MSEQRRLSITPLVEALRLDKGESVSRALGISGTALTNYTVNGVEEHIAERLAVRAGFHAWNIWPELADQAVAEVERECAAPDCNNRFVPSYPKGMKKRYCSRNCNLRVSMRERYRANPEPKRQKQREYDRMVREAKRRRAERKAA